MRYRNQDAGNGNRKGKKKEVWRKNEEGLVTRIGRGSKNDWNLETH